MNLDDYNIHVIASVFKQWLRDLPNPLMTFELYEEFIRAMGKWSTPDIQLYIISKYVFKCFKCFTLENLSTIKMYPLTAGLQDKKETIRGVYSVIDQLSRTHLNTLERLIFHLVR